MPSPSPDRAKSSVSPTTSSSPTPHDPVNINTPPPAPLPPFPDRASSKPPVVGSGYEDDPPLTDVHRLDDLPDSDDETPTTSGNQPCSSSLDRRVSHLHEDVPESINRFDSISSSMPSSQCTPPMIEVDASEVSDEIQSATDPKSRTTDLVTSAGYQTPSDPISVPVSTLCADLRFEHDPTVDISFDPVADDELEVPEAPNSLITMQPISVSSSSPVHKLRLLQTEVTTLHQQKAILVRRNESLEQRAKEIEVLLESVRVRAAESSSEVDLLMRQLKDTRRRLTRRIRELEENTSTITAKHSEELNRQREIERELRAELDTLRGTCDRQPRTNPIENNLVSRQQSDLNGTCSGTNGPKPPTDTLTRSSLSSVLDTNTRSKDSPPVSGTRGRVTIVNSDAFRRRARALDGVCSMPRSIGQSTRPGHSSRPGTPVRRFNVSWNHASNGSGYRKAHSSSTKATVTVHVQGSSSSGNGGGTSGGNATPATTTAADNQSSASIRMMARRGLIRKAFIAHIHSSKYGSGRKVWFDFFGAEGSQIDADQFTRAVRNLAVAVDARDRELEGLQDEIGAMEQGDTKVISWTAFSRFYFQTQNERA